MSSRSGKSKANAKTPAVKPRDWIAKDSSGKDSEGSQLTTVQLWWKEFESEAKSKSISPQPTPEADPSQSYLSSEDPKDHWYGVSTSYWEHVDASDDGMLGGFASITNVDLAGSLQFLLPMIMGKESNLKSKVGNSKAIDVGAGIGRITKGLLTKIFQKTDVMEQNAAFLEQAKKEMPEDKIGNYYCTPLQAFEFEGGPYDVIWMQWVLLYLIDSDLVALLKRAKAALAPHGIIVIKENHTRSGSGFYIDKDDNSITRSITHFKSIFEAAGLTLIKETLQHDFPKELFPVSMFALV